MGVNHRGRYVAVAHQLLNLPDIGAGGEQMRGEGMSERMYGRGLCDRCSQQGAAERFLNCGCRRMPSHIQSAKRPASKHGRWEYKLPTE